MVFSLMIMVLFGLLLGVWWFEVSWWVMVWSFQLGVVVVVLGGFTGIHISECSFGGFFCCDEISYGLIWLSVFVASLSLLASGDVLSLKDSSQVFLVSVLSLTVILCLCFSVSTLGLFYVFFEFSLIPILLIICGWGYQPERLWAVKYMVLYTVGASLPLLVLILVFFYVDGSMSFVLLYGMRGALSCSFVVFMAATLAFLVKSPLYGLHSWLPKAHVEAPVAGSMFLAGVLLKLGGYGLVRFVSLLSAKNGVVLNCVICLCVFGGVVASVVCCAQVDSKSLVAYSSVGHMSLVLAGLMQGSFWGLGGAYLLMVAHGLSSCGMFYLVGELYKMYSSRMLFVLRGGVGGLYGFNFWLAFMCGFNAAAPPSLSLCSEVILCISILSYSLWFSVFIGALGFFSCLYSWSLYCGTQIGSYPIWARSFKGISCFHTQGVVCSAIVFPMVGLCFCCELGKFF
uniref:NADH-ubiquinone oxidoreductase chain 4 n=1 Tax=Parvasolenaia rivularis TaxID=1491190 RepID=A0A3G1GHD6_9BIVA|nr:NADH dehydrogenase subunit 4 [Parvasolenaia rivularis]